MKKISFFTVLLILCICANSQTISVKWSAASKSKNGMPPKTILGESNGELFVLKEQYNGMEQNLCLETYASADMTLTGSTVFKLPEIAEKGFSNFIDLFMVKGKLILFFDHSSGGAYSESKYKFYGTVIDKTCQTTGDPLLLFEEATPYEYRGIGSGKRNDAMQPKDCNILISSDSSHFLLYSKNISNGKLRAKVIGANLQQLSTHELDLPFTNSFKLSNLILDEHQVFYFTSKENTTDETKFNYKVFAFDLKKNTSKSKVIPFKTTWPVADLYMSKYKNKVQVLSYYYTAVKTNATDGGTLFYEFDDNMLELKTSFEKPFDANTISQLNSNSKFLKSYYSDVNDNAINALTNSKIINMSNDDIILISEQLVKLALATTYGTDYFDVLVTRVNKTGIISNPAVIPKLQSGRSKPFYSYLPIVKDNKIYLLYNDSQKNADSEDPYKIKKGVNGLGGSVPMLVTITEKGEWSRKPLFLVDENSAYVFPSKPYYNASGEILLFGKFEDKIRFATLKP